MTTEHELTITRVFDAPRELVFAAWTDPDHLARWWGPTGFTATSCTVRLVEGGQWRLCISDGAGTDIWASGSYREIVRPERLGRDVRRPRGTPEGDGSMTAEVPQGDPRLLDTEDQAPEVLQLRGRASVTEVRGIVPQYERS